MNARFAIIGAAAGLMVALWLLSDPADDGPEGPASGASTTGELPAEVHGATAIAADRSRVPPPKGTGPGALDGAETAPDGPRLELIVTRADDGAPLPDVPLRAWPITDWTHPPQTVVTDTTGRAMLDPAPVGEVFVTPGDARIDVAPTGTTQHELVLKPAFVVRGAVVDAHDRPIVGAVIWKTDTDLDESAAAPIAETDADGRFEWIAWSRYQFVFAFAPGFATSPAMQLFGSPQEPPPFLKLALRRTRSSLSGIVVDALDRPVAGALVALSGAAPAPVDGLESDGWFAGNGRRCARRRNVAGDDGRFRFDSLAPGLTGVAARRNGRGQGSVRLDVGVDADAHVRVVLLGSASIAGRVLDTDGKPVGDVRVCVGWPGDFGFVRRRRLCLRPPNAVGGQGPTLPLPCASFGRWNYRAAERFARFSAHRT